MTKQKSKCVNGYDYPKEKIVELINTFGLKIDLDRWDRSESHNGFFRLVHPDCEEVGCIIVHMHHLETYAHMEKKHLETQFQDFLMKVGETKHKLKFHELFKIYKD